MEPEKIVSQSDLPLKMLWSFWGVSVVSKAVNLDMVYGDCSVQSTIGKQVGKSVFLWK